MNKQQRKDLLTIQFRFAQEPQTWLATGEDLATAAEAIVRHAMTRVSAYEEAEKRALAECERIGAENGTGEGTAIIDAEPPDFLPAFLLYGYALENFMKGLIIAKDRRNILDDRLGVPPVHDLMELAGHAGVALGHRDQENLERLTVITTWSGRYAVAKRVEKWDGVPLDRAAIFPSPVQSTTEIRELVDVIGKTLAAYCPSRDRRSTLIVLPDRTAPGLTETRTTHRRR